jgi:hypothetical protein
MWSGSEWNVHQRVQTLETKIMNGDLQRTHEAEKKDLKAEDAENLR